jgi:hypothetical protein
VATSHDSSMAEARCPPRNPAFETAAAEALRLRESETKYLAVARFWDVLVSKANGKARQTLFRASRGSRYRNVSGNRQGLMVKSRSRKESEAWHASRTDWTAYKAPIIRKLQLYFSLTAIGARDSTSEMHDWGRRVAGNRSNSSSNFRGVVTMPSLFASDSIFSRAV